ncbi:AMP-binding protein [Streptomyces prunicolor]|nr:AMP-binding protein [Streptomyces prunicolor]MCX5243623.1 AMP-binding protein [Streptomyces prunicolor]
MTEAHEEDLSSAAGAAPVSGCVQGVFAARVVESPDAVAVRCGGEGLSYRELDVRANRLARRLVGVGVGPEAPVAVLMERSLDLVVSLLAVLKAGVSIFRCTVRIPGSGWSGSSRTRVRGCCSRMR